MSHECDDCGRTFVTGQALGAHRRWHCPGRRKTLDEIAEEYFGGGRR